MRREKTIGRMTLKDRMIRKGRKERAEQGDIFR